MVKGLTGTQLAGGGSARGRETNDFYATDPRAVEMLIDVYDFGKGSFLEPCVGEGHIANVIKDKIPDSKVVGVDLIDRGYPNTIVCDFLTYKTNERYDNIITNPPYSLAKEFVEKSMELLVDNGKLAMFLKIQFLEGISRVELFEKYPPKYIYVFSRRMSAWRGGNPVDEKGKPWATTMCHAWFIWEKGSRSEPIVRWLL